MSKYEVKLFPVYSEAHLWARKMPDGGYKIGITDFAQQQLGDVNYADLPEEDAEIKQGEAFGTIESAKAVSDLIAPISGIVKAVNEEVLDEPQVVNRSCYDIGWLLEIEPKNWETEKKGLMTAEEYKVFLDTQE